VIPPRGLRLVSSAPGHCFGDDPAPIRSTRDSEHSQFQRGRDKPCRGNVSGVPIFLGVTRSPRITAVIRRVIRQFRG